MIILCFVRSTKVLAIILSLLTLAYALQIFLSDENPLTWLGLGLATLLTLFLILFVGRIPAAIDRLRKEKG